MLACQHKIEFCTWLCEDNRPRRPLILSVLKRPTVLWTCTKKNGQLPFKSDYLWKKNWSNRSLKVLIICSLCTDNFWGRWQELHQTTERDSTEYLCFSFIHLTKTQRSWVSSARLNLWNARQAVLFTGIHSHTDTQSLSLKLALLSDAFSLHLAAHRHSLIYSSLHFLTTLSVAAPLFSSSSQGDQAETGRAETCFTERFLHGDINCQTPAVWKIEVLQVLTEKITAKSFPPQIIGNNCRLHQQANSMHTVMRPPTSKPNFGSDSVSLDELLWPSMESLLKQSVLMAADYSWREQKAESLNWGCCCIW